MKKLYLHTLSVLVSGLLAFTACTTDETNDMNPATQPETVDIAVLVGDKGVDNSRTYVDEANNKVCWNASGEALSILYTIGTGTYTWGATTNSFELNPDTGGARFTVSLTQTGEGGYTFSAVYPTIGLKSMQPSLTVPTTQMPVEGSFDPKADLMIASAPATSETAPEQIKFDLKRVVALSKMTLAQLDPGQKVTKVKITATAPEGSAQPYLSGTVKAYLTEYTDADAAQTYPAGSVTYLGPVGFEDNTPYKTITLDLSGYDCIADDKGEITVWFTSMPVVLSGGSLFVEAKTTDYTYSRTVDLTGKELELKVNAINSFGVNLTDKTEGFNGYTIVTSADKLQEGAQIIVCNYETQNQAEQSWDTPYLLGATPKTYEYSMWGQTSTYVGYSLVSTTITEEGISLEDAKEAKVFTLVKNGDQYALQAEDGYLYATANTSENKYEIGVQSDPAYWTVLFTSSWGGFHPVALLSNNLYLYKSGSNYSCYTSNAGNFYIFQKVGGGSEPEPEPATPTYELNLKSVNYAYDMGMANLTLFETDENNYINMGLMHPNMTSNRLLAGDYPLMDDNFDGSSPVTLGGRIGYNGSEYDIVSADHITLTTDAANPDWLKVSFKVTTMNENGEEAIFTGEWSGEMDYAQTIDLSRAFASATNKILGYDDEGNMVSQPLFGVTLTGYADNISATFEMFNQTLYTSATPILTSAYTEYYPYVDPGVSPVMSEGMGCFTRNASIVYNGQTYELDYCDDSDLEFTNPKTWIKVLVTETETTIDFKLRTKDGSYVFVGSWTGTLDHTGTTPDQGGML